MGLRESHRKAMTAANCRQSYPVSWTDSSFQCGIGSIICGGNELV